MLIELSWRAADYYDNKAIDFRRFNDHFQKSLVRELDFKIELANLERTRNNFWKYDHLYMPQTYIFKSSRRTMVMEFCRGLRIDDLEGLKKRFGDKGAKKASDILLEVFAKMIFLHGFVHCDAHPGNMMVRSNPAKPDEPQIVLLDHGFYATLREDFRKDFCRLFLALTSFDNATVKQISDKMGMGEYFRYLPLLFTGRTINSKKPLGSKIDEKEIKFIKDNDEFNFEKISFLFQRLPSEVIFIFKAMHLVAINNIRAGGDRRERLVHYSVNSIEALNQKASPLWRIV